MGQRFTSVPLYAYLFLGFIYFTLISKQAVMLDVYFQNIEPVLVPVSVEEFQRQNTLNTGFEPYFIHTIRTRDLWYEKPTLNQRTTVFHRLS